MSAPLPARRGRPRSLDDPAIQVAILAGIDAGSYLTRALDLAGISRSAFFDWRSRWQAGDPGTHDLDGFFRTLEKRDALAECRALETVRTSEGDELWRSAAWFLSRRWPQRWGLARLRRRPILDHDDLSDLTDDRLDALAARLKMPARPGKSLSPHPVDPRIIAVGFDVPAARTPPRGDEG